MQQLIQQSPTKNQIEQKVNNNIAANPELEPLLKVYLEILKIQLSLLNELMASSKASNASLKQRKGQGEAILDAGDVCVDSGLFKQTVEEMCKLLEDSAQGDLDLSPFLEIEKFSPEKIDQFINNLKNEDFIYVDELSQELNLPRDLLFFIIHNAIAPFFQSAASSLWEEVDINAWDQGFCPICRHKPDVGQFDKEDNKILECSLCVTHWWYPQPGCPFCGNKSGENIEYFHLQTDPSRQVNVCLACERYLKVFDASALGNDLILRIEDFATPWLDVIAREKGYIAGAEFRFKANPR